MFDDLDRWLRTQRSTAPRSGTGAHRPRPGHRRRRSRHQHGSRLRCHRRACSMPAPAEADGDLARSSRLASQRRADADQHGWRGVRSALRDGLPPCQRSLAARRGRHRARRCAAVGAGCGDRRDRRARQGNARREDDARRAGPGADRRPVGAGVRQWRQRYRRRCRRRRPRPAPRPPSRCSQPRVGPPTSASGASATRIPVRPPRPCSCDRWPTPFRPAERSEGGTGWRAQSSRGGPDRPGSVWAGSLSRVSILPTARRMRPAGRMPALDPSVERARLDAALGAAGAELEGLAASIAARAGQEIGAIFEAQALFAHDPGIVGPAFDAIDAGLPAEEAILRSTDEQAERLAAVDDEYFRARAADVRDVGRRVAGLLDGTSRPDLWHADGRPASSSPTTSTRRPSPRCGPSWSPGSRSVLAPRRGTRRSWREVSASRSCSGLAARSWTSQATSRASSTVAIPVVGRLVIAPGPDDLASLASEHTTIAAGDAGAADGRRPPGRDLGKCWIGARDRGGRASRRRRNRPRAHGAAVPGACAATIGRRATERILRGSWRSQAIDRLCSGRSTWAGTSRPIGNPNVRRPTRPSVCEAFASDSYGRICSTISSPLCCRRLPAVSSGSCCRWWRRSARFVTFESGWTASSAASPPPESISRTTSSLAS